MNKTLARTGSGWLFSILIAVAAMTGSGCANVEWFPPHDPSTPTPFDSGPSPLGFGWNQEQSNREYRRDFNRSVNQWRH